MDRREKTGPLQENEDMEQKQVKRYLRGSVWPVRRNVTYLDLNNLNKSEVIMDRLNLET